MNKEEDLKEALISFKLAKFAVEKGFTTVIGLGHVSPRGNYYNSDGVLNGGVIKEIKSYLNNNKEFVTIGAPTQSLLQKWLREKHNIHIGIWNNASGYGYELSKADNGTTIYESDYDGPNDGGVWDTYEEVLEFALEQSLNLIK